MELVNMTILNGKQNEKPKKLDFRKNDSFRNVTLYGRNANKTPKTLTVSGRYSTVI